ncbi:hypothetical protein MYW48_05380 [Bacillus cereus]|uniref:hypothetical protein n=1 Tax=Bacillus cereus group TaxID=86661 RepID=UPI000D02F297|nr:MULTISPECIES: hypothetical protein [Bacillus cereus group]PRT31144.1 hypothetical protein C6351_06890 [Bacillus thuringiensis]UPJ17509.1 hypothetical protein MYW48_05380 [Bacillus cereus]
MNFILHGSKHTVLASVFDSFQGREKEFNWLITDIEIVAHQEEKLIRDYPKMSHPIVWIAGEDLSNLVKKYNPQFIWGVLSAFDKSINIDINNLLVEPYANGNEGLWVPSPNIQHPQAKLEIVCWDSSLMLLLSNDININDKFRNYFKEARDLNAYNSEF